MNLPNHEPARPEGTAAEQAAQLRKFTGAPEEFWPAFLKLCGQVAGAARAVLIRRDKTDGRWKQLTEWALPDASAAGLAVFRNALLTMADECGQSGVARRLLTTEAKPGAPVQAGLAIRLILAAPDELCLVAFFLPQTNTAEIENIFARVQLVADIPKSFQEHSQNQQSQHDAEKLAIVLDTLAEVNSQSRYAAAVLALCNSLASRLRCERVSLGWFERGFIRLQSISRTEKFDRKMEAVQAIEKVMEEALDQDDEILWPTPNNYSLVNRDHEAFAKANADAAVCSIPMRVEEKVVAVLTLERAAGEFTLLELQQLRLVGDQAVFRLHDLKRRDRWLGARVAEDFREKMAGLLGPEHTWMKITGLLVVVILAALFFVKINYRVEADFTLRSQEVRLISAPYKGYLEDVQVRPGDVVKAGAVILRLNRDDLLLEEVAAKAEASRYQREVEKARAGNQLAEMRVAQSQLDEVGARQQLVRYRLERAEVKSPFDAVLVEGDLRNRLGTPLEQGDPLVRLARNDQLYIEAELNERDVHEILAASNGEFAFVSQPRKKFPLKVARLEPAAIPKEGKNIFIVRCDIDGRLEDWWRPGMSGVVKINVGPRRLIWVLTHRTVDFLRLWLWW